MKNFNIESHADSIVKDIYSEEVIQKWNMSTIHVSSIEPRQSTEGENMKNNRKKYIISQSCTLINNNNRPSSPISVLFIFTPWPAVTIILPTLRFNLALCLVITPQQGTAPGWPP